MRAFGRYADWLYATPHTFFDEAEWVRRQGPLCPALIEWIRAHADDHDAFLFYTYLYLPTTLGLPLVAHKAVLVPTAHDERPIYLDLFRSLFRIPRGADLPGGGGAGVRGGALPHGAPPLGGHRRPGSTRSRTPTGRASGAQYGLEGPYLLYVGRVDVEKGCRALVDAFLAWRRAGRRAG